MDIYDRMEAIRLEKNLTCYKLAKLMGISARAVYNWKDRIGEPTYSNIVRFLEVTQTSPSRFFGDDAAWERGKEEQEVLNKWNRLDDKKKKKVMRSMDRQLSKEAD